MKHDHYFKDVSGLGEIDVYMVLKLWEVDGHAVGHAIKKLLNAGARGAKTYEQDLREAVDSIERALAMEAEPVEDDIPWDDAPDWAEWVAQDDCGTWFWYAEKPTLTGGVWDAFGKSVYALHEMPDLGPCSGTLRRRLKRLFR